MFEAKDDAARQIIISDSRAHAIMTRRTGKARSASETIGNRWITAQSATSASKEIQRFPASDAQLIIVRDNNPAPGTARGQSKIDDRTKQCRNSSHRVLVARGCCGHKPCDDAARNIQP